ncbi:MAG: hypothetical protein IT361_09945 [Gemmatimonadaceae bacterium]|nr:hypothetical protein [Gemmatimonadaceae bacterium]
MYPFLLASHNIVRWLILAAGVYVVARSWRGWMTRAAWSPADGLALRIFTHVASLQFTLGVLLALASPLVREGLGDMGAAMRTAAVRQMIVEHPLVMLIAVALIHIGAARVRKATSDSGRFQTATLWCGLALVAMLAFTPWARPLFPF